MFESVVRHYRERAHAHLFGIHPGRPAAPTMKPFVGPTAAFHVAAAPRPQTQTGWFSTGRTCYVRAR